MTSGRTVPISGVLMVGNFLSAKRGTRFYCEDFSDRLGEAGWDVTRTSSRAGRVLRLADMLYTVVSQRGRYAVGCVEVYSGPSFYWAEAVTAVLRRLHKPYVAVLHGGRLPEFRREHPRRFSRFLASATQVVTPSQYLRHALVETRADLRYLPNAIDLTKYLFRVREQPAPRICWLRAFDDTYDPAMAVRAFALVYARRPDATLTMIGPTKQASSMEAVKRVVAQNNLDAFVEFTGAVPKNEVPAILDCHDVFLNTTRYESFGVAVMEAAASGMPIVTTDVGEIPYLWSDGVDALLVRPGDAEAMAAAVLRILDEPGTAASLSRNARAKAEHFGWDAVLNTWMDVFGELAERYPDV